MATSSRLASVRADSLTIMIDILHLLFRSEHEIKVRSFYQRLGGRWKRARIYHYLSGMQQIGLLSKQFDSLRVEPDAITLLQRGRFRSFNGGELLAVEKNTFQHLLERYKPFTEFLSMFLKSGEMFTTFEQFVTDSSFITLFRKTSKNCWYIKKADGSTIELNPTKRKEIHWTLKYWALSLDLIDELHPEMNKGYAGRVYDVFFPLKASNVSLDQFREWLLLLAEEHYFFDRRVAIPELMYFFCTKYFVRTKEFLSKLVKLYLAQPGSFRLEHMSRAGIDERPHLAGRRISRSDPGHTYSNYPRINWAYYGTAIIRKRPTSYGIRTLGGTNNG